MAHESLAKLVNEIRKAAADMVDGDARTNARIDQLAKSLDGVLVRLNRPGTERGASDNEIEIRKQAADFCILRRNVTVPKSDGGANNYVPSPSEIDDAITARTALTNLWRLGDPNRLQGDQRKSLSSFMFGTNEFLLPPVMATQVLSCITDLTDVSGLVNTVTISGPSIRYLIDNQRMSVAAWACETTCFSNNPQPDLQAGLGEMEIKPETIRFIQCVTNDLLADTLEAELPARVRGDCCGCINMRDHYKGFSHPVLDFAPDMAKSLFEEFDSVAEECRAHALFVEQDLQIAFPQLCRLRGLDLAKQDWLWLFDIWRDHDGGQQEFLSAKRQALLDSLRDERELLFKTRERFPEYRVEMTARLYEIGLALAELEPKCPAAPLGKWV